MLPSRSKKGLMKLGRQHSSFNEYKDAKKDTCERCGTWLTDIPISKLYPNEDVYARKKGFCLECFTSLEKHLKAKLHTNIQALKHKKFIEVKGSKGKTLEQDKQFNQVISLYGLSDEDIAKKAFELLGYSLEDINNKKHLHDWRLGYKCTCLSTKEKAPTK